MNNISDKLNIINDSKNDIKTAIENKGVNVGEVGIQELANKINEIPGPPTKGIVIQESDSSGYVTKAKVVGLTTIPSYAFAQYNTTYVNMLSKNLKTIDLSDGVTKLNDYAFYNCANLIDVIFSDNFQNIQTYAFSGCTKLAITSLPDSVIVVGKYGFQGCTNLQISKLPSLLRNLNDYCFSGCKNSTFGNIPEGVETVPKNCFYNCTNLVMDKLPKSVKYVYNYAFYNCTSLKELDCLNESYFRLESSAFYGCTNLEKLILRQKGSYVYMADKAVLANTAIANGTGYIYVPDDLVEKYKTATNWSTYASQIKGISELEG